MDGGKGSPSAVPEGTILGSRISRELYAYWHSLALYRGGIPWRDDFDPAAVPALLPYLFIVEQESATGRYLFRLSGTGIREIMGMENTGRYLDELLSGTDLDSVSEMFHQVMSEGVCIRSVEGLTYSDHCHQRVEILRLPLRKNDSNGNLVLGCLSRVEGNRREGNCGTAEGSQVIFIENDVVPRQSF